MFMVLYYTIKIAWFLRVNAIKITVNSAPTDIQIFVAIRNLSICVRAVLMPFNEN